MADLTVEQYISQQTEPQQMLLNALHQFIKKTAPELQESIKWGFPSYAGKSNVCYLAAQKNHVNLGFYEGGLLPDAGKLLEGTGAKMRHVKVRSLNEIAEKPLAELIREAVAFQHK
ncbi:DUF1801 domain-containing protein [Adhaeribacter sp. BT258]|uniref:DUF1801 domain-containing protein n=1 Tax=Adhaeribacter terrigena TaxID=2793070 RepID=A0ABS1C1D0_9BACT|nr:DUF1801 domain-containing protein [Adhaeribacter terrigena]MBK0402423.1 DUF1801 domain-containing protein [Adhaeribacter terrigena]